MGDFTDLLGQPDEQAPLATPAAPQRKSQFQSLIDGPSPQDAALGSNLLGAASTTPDAHAKAMDIGGTIGAPADAVAANMQESERLARLQRYQDALGDAPKMAALLAEDPDLAKISADDLELLGKNESTLGKIMSAFYGVTPEHGGKLADVGASVPQGALQAVGGGLAGLGEINDVLGRTIERGMRAVGLDTAADALTNPVLPWWLNPSGIVKQPGTALKDLGEAVGPAEDRQNIATDIGSGVGQVIGQIGTALLTGGSASVAMLLGQGADQLHDRVVDAGQEGTAAGDAATVMGAAVTALTEKLGLDALLHRVPPAVRNTILRQITDIGLAGGIEAVQEVTEGILQNVIEKFTVNPDAELLAGWQQDATAAGGTGAVIRALVNAAAKGRQISSNVHRQQQAGQDAATVEALVKGTADSKLRERNPDAFAAVMAAQTQGTPVETFYLPATAIAELYQSGAGTFDDDPLNQIEGLREQLQEALAVGGDVEISAADYLTHIAPTELHGRLKNDLRASRDGWSVNDAKEYAEDPAREVDLSALVERLALQNEGAAVGQATFDDAYRQFMDTGKHESHQAAAQATLLRERYIAQAAARGAGEDPDALYLRDQVRISGPGALARVRRGDLDVVIARLKSGETVQAAKTPVLDIVRSAGGVKLGSQLDSELRAMGVNPKTHPGLFRKTGGIGDVDNFVLSEHDVLRDNGVPDSGNGYADRGAVLEALRREAGGRGAALLTQDEREQRARLDEPVSVLAEQLEAAGLDVNTMTADEIKAWATGQQTAVPVDAQGALFQSVYHGSPHVFDKFSTAAIGSGEGAQAYGFGLYFASKKEIAKHYRAMLAGSPHYEVDGVDAATLGPGVHSLVKSIAKGWRTLDGVIESMERDVDEWVDSTDSAAERERRRDIRAQRLAMARSLVGKKIEEVGGGRLYTVEIPDDGEYLLWDKKLSEQPAKVRGAVERVKAAYAELVPPNNALDGDIRGSQIYQLLAGSMFSASPRGASSDLMHEGIRGIKYLDASARDSTEDSFNYVVFADSDVVIQSYEQAAAGGARGSYQRVRDPYGNLSNVIRLTEGANLSTVLHEMGHFFLFQLIDDATLPGATAEARAKLQADLQAVLDHLGIKVDVATASADQIHAAMTREAHELWARSFEVYAREGKAPSAALRDAFASFASWLVRIYRTLRDIPDYRKKLTPEVRGVMDRLLATEDAIKDAQASSSFRVPSALRSVMTAAEQKSLEKLTAQANMEAKEELTKRVMKELERERLEWWKEERAKVRERVEADVRSRPVYRAYNLIRTGETADGGQLVDENGNPRAMKLDRNLLERDYGKDIVKLLPKGLTAKDGASHHVVASWTGFGSADELRDALLNLQPMKEVVEAETDTAMKQRHGDMLSDGRIAEDASEVVLNEKQLELAGLQARALRRLAASVMEKAAARTVAETGAKGAAENRAAVLEAQADEEAVATMGVPAEGVAGVSAETQMAAATAAASVGQRTAQRAALRQTRGVQSGLDVKAITAAAKKAIAGKRIEDAVPGRYRAQAERLGRQIEQAIAKRDYQTAAALKEQQLINLALAREAQEVQADVGKALKRFGRLNKPDAKLAKAQNIDFVGAVRAILSRFGLSRPQAGYDQQVWFQRLREDSPADEVLARDMIDDATKIAGTVAARGRTRTRAKPGGAPVGQIWRQMTVDEFRNLTETVDAILHMGREGRTAEIDGERVEMKQVVDDLNAQASSRDTGKRVGQTSKATEAEKVARKFRGLAASLERVETWARRMDDGKPNGPFTRTFVKPILSMVYEYRAARQDKLTRLLAIIEPRKGELLGKSIAAPELNYTFANRGELLHAILHTGNESNMRKLLLGGRGEGFAWAKKMPDGSLDTSRWDNMIRRMVQEGIITKADYDTAQQIWDLFEETKGPAQIAFRKMKGYYFKEVEVTGIQTPFGRYKGGYAPAIPEKSLVAESGSNIDADAMGQLANAGVLPGVGAGFTKSRVENYTKPLELNLMKLPGHLDSVLKLTYLGPAVRQAARIARNREFRDAMFGIDPAAIDDMLVPWLHRVARQTSEIPYTQDAERTIGKALGWLRKSTGMQAMAGNVINALQQITGLSSGMVRVKPAAVLRGLVASVKAPNASTAMITQKSAFMRDRMANTTHDLMANLDDLLTDKWKITKVSEKAQKHGYIAQVLMQNFVDKALWLGAHERALAKGMTDAEAVLEADSVIRTTQGSFNPEDASNAEARAALGRLFTMFYSYFNTQYNLLRSEAEIAVRESGWAGASPRLFAIYVMGVFVPAVLAEAMVEAARGELGDDDDDGLWDDIGELFGLSQLKYFAAMVPFAGSLVNLAINLANDRPYDDRLATAPVFGQVERLVTSGSKLVTGAESKASQAVKDALNILGTAFGLPLGQLGKPLGYITDVISGEQQGETVGDWVRGTLSGREAPKQ